MTVSMEEVVWHLSNTDKPVQLVKHIDEVPESKLKWPAIAEVKEDGVYCLVVVLEREPIVLFTRTGKRMYFEHSQCSLNFTGTNNGYAYIAELVNPNVSLETLSGLVNPNRVNNWNTEEVLLMQGAKLVYHDVVSIAELMQGASSTPFVDRRYKLFSELPSNSLVRGVRVNSMDDFEAFTNANITLGGEGAVLKQLNAPWIAGHKGFHVTKKVRGIHVDLRCTGVKYGKPGKHQHWIAALEFEYKGKKFWADLGKGWDNNKRDYLTKGYEKNRYNVIGQVFHVKALQESSKGVLRLPKVAESRIDKEEQD